MLKQLGKSKSKRKTISYFGYLADLAIKKRFNLSNYNMYLLFWLKGLWMGFLLSIIIHNLLYN